MATNRSKEAEQQARAAACRLGSVGAMRRGSVTVRYVKCSKPNCACRGDQGVRHGPYISLTYSTGGKTHSRLLSAAQAEIVRQQIDAGRKFREQVRTLWAACEAWADAELNEMADNDPGCEPRPRRRRVGARVALN